MEKRNKIYLGIILVCTFLVIIICGLCIYGKNKSTNKQTDAMRFKEEYEAFNDRVLSDGKTPYLKLNIPQDNPFIYKSPKEILDVLTSETAIIYFGYAACPLARDTVEILLEAALEKNIKTIYYVDIQNIRDEYEANGTLFPTKTKNGSAAYQALVSFFDEHLEVYYVEDSNNFAFSTGVKRIASPTVAVVDHGEVKSIYAGKSEDELNFINGLNEEQKEIFKNKYIEMFSYINDKENVVCTEKGC